MSKTILHIDSSPMGDRSASKKLTQKLVADLQSQHAGSTVVYHDFSVEAIPHLDGATLGAFFTPDDQRTPEHNKLSELSDTLTNELLAADIVVIAAPMWNFNIPSALKAWIDHVSRAGKTFKYTESGVQGLVPAGKKVIIVSSSGGIYSEGPAAKMDFQVPYLKAFFGFLGMSDVTVVRAEGTAMGPDAAAKAIQDAESELATLVK